MARDDDARRRNIVGIGAGIVIVFLVVQRLSNAEDGGQGWALIGIGAIVMIVGAMWGRPGRK